MLVVASLARKSTVALAWPLQTTPKEVLFLKLEFSAGSDYRMRWVRGYSVFLETQESVWQNRYGSWSNVRRMRESSSKHICGETDARGVRPRTPALGEQAPSSGVRGSGTPIHVHANVVQTCYLLPKVKLKKHDEASTVWRTASTRLFRGCQGESIMDKDPSAHSCDLMKIALI